MVSRIGTITGKAYLMLYSFDSERCPDCGERHVQRDYFDVPSGALQGFRSMAEGMEHTFPPIQQPGPNGEPMLARRVDPILPLALLEPAIGEG